MTAPGTLYGIGVGPGDPELLTLKAVRLIQSCPVIAYPAAEHRRSIARGIVAAHLRDDHQEIALRFPLSDSAAPAQRFYDETAEMLAERLRAGLDVAVLCEGDPLFYGTFMYLHTRLAPAFRVQVVPGVSSMTASAAALGVPLAFRNDVVSVIPAGLPAEVLRARLEAADAAVIIKVGRYLATVREVLHSLGLQHRARYIAHATTEAQTIIPLDDVDPAAVPYFSMIVVPSGWQP
jgi:precorrin-2/cobalt-factor-2 C20-methyltransferase